MYGIFNLASGKVYVGSSRHVLNRWSSHRHRLSIGKHKNKQLQKVWNTNEFTFRLIEECSLLDLLDREQFWLNKFQDKYNIQPNAGTPKGQKLTVEHRAKISASHKGMLLTEESKRKISAKLKGRVGRRHTKASKHKISLANLGKKLTSEHREKLRIAHLGMKHSEEAKRKIGLHNVGMTGKRHSKAACKKMSDTKRKRFAERYLQKCT